jgi:hypothetical protein
MAIVTDLHWYQANGELRTGYYLDRWLKQNLDGIPAFLERAFDVVAIVSGTGKVRLGKAQPIGSKVLMSNGEWKNIEKICVGDKVISPSIDGKNSEISKVLETIGHKQLDMCEIRSSRDNSLLYTCCVDHNVPVKTLWIKKSPGKKEYIWKDEIYPADELANKNNEWYKNHCPKIITSPIINKFEFEDYKVNPYLLGLYIGDGSISSKKRISITNPNLDIIKWLEENTEVKARYLKKGTQCFNIRIKYDTNNLKDCGIGSHNKKIPIEVFKSSYEYRKRVFEGLLDTDAYIDPNGYVVYTTSSEQLSYDVKELSKTLGCRSSIHITSKHCQSFKEGEKRKYFNVHINVGELSRKLNIIRERKERLLKVDLTNERNKNSQFESIIVSKIDKKIDGYCIQVDSDSRLYITDNYSVTHNSTLALQIAYYVAWIIAGGRTILNERGQVIEVKEPTGDIKFSIDNIVFSPDELKEKAEKLPKHSVIVYDEGRVGLQSDRHMENVNKQVADFFQECGQYGHVIIIVLPDFFKLGVDYATNRSLFLVNVFADKDFNRGYFNFYNENSKEKLYLYGKKKVGTIAKYNSYPRNFWGRFSAFIPVDKTAYEQLKRDALSRKKYKMPEILAMKQRDMMFWLYSRNPQFPIKKLSDLFDKAEVTLNERIFSRSLANAERMLYGKKYIPDGWPMSEREIDMEMMRIREGIYNGGWQVRDILQEMAEKYREEKELNAPLTKVEELLFETIEKRNEEMKKKQDNKQNDNIGADNLEEAMEIVAKKRNGIVNISKKRHAFTTEHIEKDMLMKLKEGLEDDIPGELLDSSENTPENLQRVPGEDDFLSENENPSEEAYEEGPLKEKVIY